MSSEPAARARLSNSLSEGVIRRVAGPVVVAQGLVGTRLYDVVHVGHERLVGEVIRLSGACATIQVYEDTSGLRAGDPVWGTGAPLQVELGPGLLGGIFDGIQRPLSLLWQRVGDWVSRGVEAPPLDRERRWLFLPQVRVGERVSSGDILGVVPETPRLAHRVLVPPGVSGVVEEIADGEVTVLDRVAVVCGHGRAHPIPLRQLWPARQPRPCARRLAPDRPLITGLRVIDTFFPVAQGGSAIIPGGFGTGKTVTQQSLARWADADVIVYVGCGERGNEMAEVLETFPQLEDPRYGGPLMNRTILIANTSNMPVAAREASIYTGITIAEYFRDMGWNVALMADSTSRWGEALREISGRLEEMPAEEGFPAYLAARLAEFYERAGRVVCLAGDRDDGTRDEQGNRLGSVTLVGAVSPPGGDFSEPITQHTLRVAGTFWSLNVDLARRRHFPAIDWRASYTLYDVSSWFCAHVAEEWESDRRLALALLQKEGELLETVRLVGSDALAEPERVVLHVGRLLREDFLQQSAFNTDAYCPLPKQYWMLRVILHYYQRLDALVRREMTLARALQPSILDAIARMREWPAEDAQALATDLIDQIDRAFAGLEGGEGSHG
jgi:V/A-type H+-transporting ATPase subunit A